jgi:hypothetical protein
MVTSRTDPNVGKVAEMEKNDYQFIVWIKTEGVNMNRETVLIEEMIMDKVCAKILLKISAVNKNMRKIFL